MGSGGTAIALALSLVVVSNDFTFAFNLQRGDLHGRPLRLRGGSLVNERQKPSLISMTDELAPEETKPDLRRKASRLVLDEAKENVTSGRATLYKIDGKEVTEEVYNQRVVGVTQRNLDPWIAQSDRGGLKEGDIVVPDHISSIPEAVAAVAHDATVYIRKGYYKWDGVLVVQKHMHIRGEPNPDEGDGGEGRPTLEGRWLLGERSSGSFKHVNCIARFDNKGEQQGAADQ